MNKPHWEIIHDGWIDDLKYFNSVRDELILMLRKHPNDCMTTDFKDMIKTTDEKIKQLRKEYKKIYGCYPPNKLIKNP